MIAHWLTLLLIFLILGAFTGLMAGILGIGGGLVVVPGLLFIFEYSHIIPQNQWMHVAAGTSLAAMILTSLAAIRAHRKVGKILRNVYERLYLGIIIGTIVGVFTAQWIATQYLQYIFAVFLLLVATKMFLDVKVTQPERSPPTWLNRSMSFMIGFKSGLLGVGGGMLIIPYLTYSGVEIRKITAVSNLCTLTVACVGSLTFIITGYYDTQSIPYALGYIYLPAALLIACCSSITAPIGARLSYVLPVAVLRYAFIVILILTAFKMLF